MRTRKWLALGAMGLALLLGGSNNVYAAKAKPAPKSQTQPSGTNETAITEQLAQYINQSELAVACETRTTDWRKTRMTGMFATINMTIDDEDHVTSIIRAAKLMAALSPSTKFSAPTQEDCAKLAESTEDMKQMDSAAKIGLMFNAVNDQ